MGLVKEFKEFAMRGSVVDLAVGVVIGAAFGTITKSLVDDLLMPPIGKLMGNIDFSNMYVSLSDKVDAANQGLTKTIAATQPSAGGVLSVFDTATRLPLTEARKLGPVIAYGNTITVIINFIIVAFCVFLLVKGMNTLKRKEVAAPPAGPTPDQKLLTEIRDLLAKKI